MKFTVFFVCCLVANFFELASSQVAHSTTDSSAQKSTSGAEESYFKYINIKEIIKSAFHATSTVITVQTNPTTETYETTAVPS